MCGIIGFTSNKTTKKQLDAVKIVMTESRIRGMHASGIVAATDGKRLIKVVSQPIDKLVQEIDWESMLGHKVTIIAHARYSTSDINYNQPIVGSSGIVIAHNGVITQSPPEHWEQLYGYKTKTKNDSELLLRCIIAGQDPLEVFPDSSIAALVMKKDNEIYSIRNGLRPLWKGTVESAVIYGSTFDILSRAGVNEPQRVPCSGTDKQVYSNHVLRIPILI